MAAGGVERGGKAVFGACLGICVLDTRFPRVEGDIGNAETWPFPVQYRVVRGVSAAGAVREDDARFLDLFVAAGRDLVASGCDGVATTCGFLVPMQARLADALGVPVATSALMQVPMVQAMLPAGRVPGIVTIDAAALTERHLAAASVGPDVPVAGTDPEGEFAGRILGGASEMDIGRARAEVVAASVRLAEAHPEVGALVLECTNMVPYARDVRRATGLPVFSIYTYLTWFQAALAPRRFSADLGDPAGAGG